MDNHNMPHKRYAKTMLLLGALLALAAPHAFAVELGMNYYHESLMGTWGTAYTQRTDAEISRDLDDIKTLTRYVKLYANPLVDGNIEHVKKITRIAKDKGMDVTVTMFVDDRRLDHNWWAYKEGVKNACNEFNGLADTFIVGNEMKLHTDWSSWEVRNRAEELINECSFGGPVSYEAFWWTKDAWKGYDGDIWFNMYEHYDSFSGNIDELQANWGGNARIGEFGDNPWGQDNQKAEVEKRWNKIKTTSVPVAYAFTYREPSADGDFGLLDNNYNKKPAWYVLGGSSTSTATTQTSTKAPSSTSSDISGIQESFSSNAGGWETTDSASGECRTIAYGTGRGEVKILACKKGQDIEMYRQQAPSGLDWELKLGAGTLSDERGFDRFTPGATSAAATTWSPNPSGSGVSGLNLLFEGNGWKTSDTLEGACRTVTYGTPSGEAKVLACEKGSEIEMYRQSNPSTWWKLTLGGGSVGSEAGFVRFTPTGASDGETPTPTATTPSSGNSWSATPNGRQVKHEDQGACELAAYNTDAGYIEALACDKGGAWEMYLKSSPNGAKISFGGGTVGANSGFARW